MDSLAIPANAKNKEGALKLINFLLRPDVAKQVAETIGYPTPNLAARKLLSPEVANDKRSTRMLKPLKMVNGRMTLAQPAAFMKSIIRS